MALAENREMSRTCQLRVESKEKGIEFDVQKWWTHAKHERITKDE